jgi:hypothetical protein
MAFRGGGPIIHARHGTGNLALPARPGRPLADELDRCVSSRRL